MKVIMIKDVGGVGQRGKIIEVSDGYALNYLIPHRMAEQATAQKESDARKRMATEDAVRDKEIATNQAVVKSLNGEKIKLAAKASEKGGLFKSIGAMEIAKAIMAQKGGFLRVEAIQLDRPIKATGDHAIRIKASGVEAEITLTIVRA